jgi:adenosylcobinamide-GDP ribazoletransferase
MTEEPGGLRQAVAFLTAVGGAATPSPAALPWFPAVGALVGVAVGGVWWGAARLWAPGVAAALALTTDLAITGLLHLDGLCDAADGLLPHLTRERRLEVMSQADIGAFAIGVAAMTLLLRWVALIALRPSVLVIAALWAASRTWMAAAALGVPYARPGGGVASAFVTGEPRGILLPVAAAGMGGALVLALVWRPLAGPVAVGSGTAAAAAVVVLARRRLGGFTGDVLGAAGTVGETVGLVVACAKW